MKIQFLGHASFLIVTDAGTRIVTDPFDPKAYEGRLNYRAFDEPADVVTLSHDHGDHAGIATVKGNPIIIRGAGKFRASEIDFVGVATYHDDARGEKRGKNTIFVISVNALRIAHMGDLGHVLTSDQAAAVGAVDVALIPVGGHYTIDAKQAWEVAAQVDARVVIPMHYSSEKCLFPIAPVDDFIAGKTNVVREGVSTLEAGADSLPNERTIVVLEPTL